ncbi:MULTISPECIES: hypothetical protein [Protofrankia]|uniref:Uncharacterized protein n=1 Tax=Protofrankia coriariae TaxID=1562887 RepID=A0ABR5F5D6_9ACTN|nr:MULTISPECIES: hypothetical protein [Protofrankia]KLL11907.1 hypothetical protein FrCorBMG51_07610 [Protofrankia coriariae]ONH36771.1 hypothetical protein BL254_05895 [Protofrankia sp. BMG5.30]
MTADATVCGMTPGTRAGRRAATHDGGCAGVTAGESRTSVAAGESDNGVAAGQGGAGGQAGVRR